MNRVLRHRILACALMGFFPVVAAHGAQVRQRPGAIRHAHRQEPKKATIGDIKVTYFGTLTGKLDLSDVHLASPDTLIEVPDRATNSLFVLHADDIRILKENNRVGGFVEAKGHVHYTLTKKTASGEAKLEGGAGHATFHRAMQKIQLTEGINATLTDPAQLRGPATLRGGQATVDISAAPYRYTVEGDPEETDLRLTPVDTARNGAPAGTVHVHAFESGAFQLGQQGRFEGAGTTIDYTNSTDQTQARLQARQVVAEFTGTSVDLRRAEVTGAVRYHIERTTSPRNILETVDGTCGTAIYLPKEATLTLNGGVDATLTAPAALQGPAHVQVERAVVHTTAPYRYELTGEPAHARVQFTPRPTPRTAQGAPAAGAIPFAFGTVTVLGFADGTFQPGKEAVFTGDQTTFQTENKPARTLSELKAKRVVAAFTEEQVIRQAEATGDVHFRLQQPTATGKALQTIQGTALHAVFTNTDQSRSVQAQGPLRVQVTNPESLAEPGHITGETGDTLSFDLTSQEFALESPKHTGTLDFTPLDTGQGAVPTKPAPAVKPVGAGKH